MSSPRSSQPVRTRRNWAGVWVPLALVLGLAADGASRFLSIDGLAIRAWEALGRNAFTEGGVPFEPRRHYVNPRAFGDLAASLNRPANREYRREEFTTDAWGFRNARPSSVEQPPDAILVGTSFSVGSGVSDPETLAAQLERLTGARVYNAAGGTPSPERILDIARRLGMGRGSVLLELYESNGFPERPRPVSRVHQECIARLGETCLKLKGWLRASPLQIGLQRAYRILQDDRWLPNLSDQPGPPPQLTDGTPMLFGNDRTPTECPEVSDAAAREYFRWFRDALPGFEVFVVLVPGKASVYGDLVTAPLRVATSGAGAERPFPGSSAAEAPMPPCRERIGTAVTAAGLPFLDLTSTLRDAARRGYPNKRYLYFLDDTHWNRYGIGVAAEAIASRWRPRSPAGAGNERNVDPGPAGGTLDHHEHDEK
jgi:SGNH hydrolase-like domain, acetyltransferase AlgX